VFFILFFLLFFSFPPSFPLPLLSCPRGVDEDEDEAVSALWMTLMMFFYLPCPFFQTPSSLLSPGSSYWRCCSSTEREEWLGRWLKKQAPLLSLSPFFFFLIRFLPSSFLLPSPLLSRLIMEGGVMEGDAAVDPMGRSPLFSSLSLRSFFPPPPYFRSVSQALRARCGAKEDVVIRTW